MTAEEDQRDREWQELYSEVRAVLKSHGTESPTGHGDFLLVDDDYGWRRQIINIFTLRMLDSAIVAKLRELLRDLPNWEIVIAVDIPEKEGKWPPMGVTIRHHEIIDGLSRDHLPEPYKSLVIPGSRPGTGYD